MRLSSSCLFCLTIKSKTDIPMSVKQKWPPTKQKWPPTSTCAKIEMNSIAFSDQLCLAASKKKWRWLNDASDSSVSCYFPETPPYTPVCVLPFSSSRILSIFTAPQQSTKNHSLHNVHFVYRIFDILIVPSSCPHYSKLGIWMRMSSRGFSKRTMWHLYVRRTVKKCQRNMAPMHLDVLQEKSTDPGDVCDSSSSRPLLSSTLKSASSQGHDCWSFLRFLTFCSPTSRNVAMVSLYCFNLESNYPEADMTSDRKGSGAVYVWCTRLEVLKQMCRTPYVRKSGCRSHMVLSAFLCFNHVPRSTFLFVFQSENCVQQYGWELALFSSRELISPRQPW